MKLTVLKDEKAPKEMYRTTLQFGNANKREELDTLEAFYKKSATQKKIIEDEESKFGDDGGTGTSPNTDTVSVDKRNDIDALFDESKDELFNHLTHLSIVNRQTMKY